MTGDRVTAAQPGSPAGRLRAAPQLSEVSAGSALMRMVFLADLAAVLDALDLVADAAANALLFGQPLASRDVLACLDEALGTAQVRSSSHVGEGT